MPKHYTYLVSCIRETSIDWGIELQSLANPVPPKVVRLPHLTRPLTNSPYFQSKCNPISYLKQLIKGMTDMLRDYHTRVFRKIQIRLENLEVGERCYVQVSYTDNGSEIKPHNYEIQLLKTPPLETLKTNGEKLSTFSAALNADNFSGNNGEETGMNGIDSAQPSAEHQRKPTVENTTEVVQHITQLHERVRKLQSDMVRMKERLDEGRRLSERILNERDFHTPNNKAEAGGKSNPPRIRNKRVYMRPTGEIDPQKKDSIMLNQDESTAIQYIMDQKKITESQLRKQYHIGNASEVMASLIDKMEQYNSPCINVQKDENGKLVYHWNQPDDAAMAASNTT